MDSDEARVKCAEMGLGEEVTEFISDTFERMNTTYDEDHDRHCQCGNSPVECERTTGEDGKIAWGQSHQDVLDELAEAMGFDTDVDDWSPDDHPELMRVWNAFFQE